MGIDANQVNHKREQVPIVKNSWKEKLGKKILHRGKIKCPG